MAINLSTQVKSLPDASVIVLSRNRSFSNPTNPIFPKHCYTELNLTAYAFNSWALCALRTPEGNNVLPSWEPIWCYQSMSIPIEPNCICSWTAEHCVLPRMPRGNILNSCDPIQCYKKLYQFASSLHWIKVQTQLIAEHCVLPGCPRAVTDTWVKVLPRTQVKILRRTRVKIIPRTWAKLSLDRTRGVIFHLKSWVRIPSANPRKSPSADPSESKNPIKNPSVEAE